MTAPVERTLAWYRELRAQVEAHGYGYEITWSEGIQPVSDPHKFWLEFSWVVLNSGMREQVARHIWAKVRPRVESGGSAGDVFGHAGKAKAIDHVYANRVDLLAQYIAAADKMAFLQALPQIGMTTSWHLAKNFGADVAKPDRHLVRIAGEEGTHAMCARLARESGDRIATVDSVIWRAANIGLDAA